MRLQTQKLLPLPGRKIARNVISDFQKRYGLARPRYDHALRAYGVTLLFEKGVSARILNLLNPELLRGFSPGDVIYVCQREELSFITDSENPTFKQITLPKAPFTESVQILSNLLHLKKAALVPENRIELPTPTNFINQQLVYFLLTGKHKPAPGSITFDTSGRYLLYNFKKKTITPSCGAIKGIQKERVFARAADFGHGSRGTTYFIHRNNRELPLISHVLFENGAFLESPRSFRFDLEASQVKNLPATDDLWRTNIIYYLATGKCKPSPEKMTLKKYLNIYSMGKSPLYVRLCTLSIMSGQNVTLEFREFNNGQRGIVVWKLKENGEPDFPLISHILFKEGKFLERPESYAYGLRHFSPENIPVTQDLENMEFIRFLATGAHPPLDREVKVRTGGSVEKSYTLREIEVRRHIRYIPDGEVILRCATRFSDGSRGEIYYRMGEKGERLYPIVGYKLFKQGEFLATAEELLLGLENFSKNNLPSTQNPDNLHYIYFLATGKRRPPRQHIKLSTPEGRDHVYQMGRPVDLYVSQNREIIAEGIEREFVEFSNGTRGAIYYRIDGTPICSYILFENGAFIRRRPKRTAGALPVAAPSKRIAPSITLDPQMVNEICQAMKTAFRLPAQLGQEDIFPAKDNQWTQTIKQAFTERKIIYIGELQAELGQNLDRASLKHLVMNSALKKHFALTLTGSLRDIPNDITRKRITSWVGHLTRIFFHKHRAIVSDRQGDLSFTKQEVIEIFKALTPQAKRVKYRIVGYKKKQRIREIVYQGYRIAFKIEEDNIKFYEHVPQSDGNPADIREAPEIFKADGSIKSLAIYTYEKDGIASAFSPFARGELTANRVQMVLTNQSMQAKDTTHEIMDVTGYYNLLIEHGKLIEEHLQKAVAEQNFLHALIEGEISIENLASELPKFSLAFRVELESIIKALSDPQERLAELKTLYYGQDTHGLLVKHLNSLPQDLRYLRYIIGQRVGDNFPQGYSRTRIPTRGSEPREPQTVAPKSIEWPQATIQQPAEKTFWGKILNWFLLWIKR